MFIQTFRAYRETIGRAYPHRDPVAVLKVLGECALPLPLNQVAIASTTGVSTAEVNKIISQALANGWVHLEARQSGAGTKLVSLTDAGMSVLSEFDRRCDDSVRVAVLQLNPSAETGRQVRSTGRSRRRGTISDDEGLLACLADDKD